MKRVSDRLAGLAATLLLQAVFIALFVQTQHPGVPPKELAHELTFILPRLQPVPQQRTSPRAAPRPLTEMPPAPPVINTPPPIAAPPAAIPPAIIQGFGQSLFGCAPENLGNLSPQERARCGTGIAPQDGTAMIAPPSHVKDPTRRAAELAARNTPGRVPCTHLEMRALGSFGATPTETIMMVDPICVTNGLLSGFRVTGLPP